MWGTCIEMLSAISTALSIGGAVASTSTSWLAIFVALLAMLGLWAYEERIKVWIQGKIPDENARKAVGSKPFLLGLQVVIGFILMWIAVIFSNISILQPNLLVGYTSQPPLRFGRYIASIGRAATPSGGYCPQAEITGAIANISNKTISLWTGGATPTKVWTQSPSVTFTSADIANVGGGGIYGNSTIAPGSSLQVTISAQMDPSLCKDYKEADLRNLRAARINATSAVWVADDTGHNPSLQSVSFLDLPIALGD